MTNGKSNGKIEVVGSPVAVHDFSKANGLERSVHLVMPVGASMTRQEFAAECDINSIMKQYESHLADPARSVREPVYYDFTAMPETLMDAMAIMIEGERAFMTLPADVRREFDNNAAMFVDFASNPDNLEQMQDWGLAPVPAGPAAPLRVEVVNPPPAPEGPSGPSGASETPAQPAARSRVRPAGGPATHGST